MVLVFQKGYSIIDVLQIRHSLVVQLVVLLVVQLAVKLVVQIQKHSWGWEGDLQKHFFDQNPMKTIIGCFA